MKLATCVPGDVYGRLTVLSPAAPEPRFAGRTAWRCRCACGRIKAILAKSLRNGGARSCGCGIGKSAALRMTTHGDYGSREYSAWCAMKTRCFNPRYRRYRDYGGRGITVCDRWRDSYAAFREDMGLCPAGFTLDRIDTNGPYAPSNCRWASTLTQANNTRVNHRLSLGGQSLTVAQWERQLGFRAGTLKRRLLRGWTAESALTTPVRPW